MKERNIFGVITGRGSTEMLVENCPTVTLSTIDTIWISMGLNSGFLC
jgi:hypothetical protein